MVKNYWCKICGSGFSRKYDFIPHVKKYHRDLVKLAVAARSAVKTMQPASTPVTAARTPVTAARMPVTAARTPVTAARTPVTAARTLLACVCI